jgi:hypothetical protein
MKKSFLIAIAGILLLGSCKKEYTCTCTTKVATVVTNTTKYTTDKKSKKDAVAECNLKAGVTSYNGVTTNITCIIN